MASEGVVKRPGSMTSRIAEGIGKLGDRLTPQSVKDKKQAMAQYDVKLQEVISSRSSFYKIKNNEYNGKETNFSFIGMHNFKNQADKFSKLAEGRQKEKAAELVVSWYKSCADSYSALKESYKLCVAQCKEHNVLCDGLLGLEEALQMTLKKDSSIALDSKREVNFTLAEMSSKMREYNSQLSEGLETYQTCLNSQSKEKADENIRVKISPKTNDGVVIDYDEIEKGCIKTAETAVAKQKPFAELGRGKVSRIVEGIAENGIGSTAKEVYGSWKSARETKKQQPKVASTQTAPETRQSEGKLQATEVLKNVGTKIASTAMGVVGSVQDGIAARRAEREAREQSDMQQALAAARAIEAEAKARQEEEAARESKVKIDIPQNKEAYENALSDVKNRYTIRLSKCRDLMEVVNRTRDVTQDKISALNAEFGSYNTTYNQLKATFLSYKDFCVKNNDLMQGSKLNNELGFYINEYIRTNMRCNSLISKNEAVHSSVKHKYGAWLKQSEQEYDAVDRERDSLFEQAQTATTGETVTPKKKQPKVATQTTSETPASAKKRAPEQAGGPTPAAQAPTPVKVTAPEQIENAEPAPPPVKRTTPQQKVVPTQRESEETERQRAAEEAARREAEARQREAEERQRAAQEAVARRAEAKRQREAAEAARREAEARQRAAREAARREAARQEAERRAAAAKLNVAEPKKQTSESNPEKLTEQDIFEYAEYFANITPEQDEKDPTGEHAGKITDLFYKIGGAIEGDNKSKQDILRRSEIYQGFTTAPDKAAYIKEIMQNGFSRACAVDMMSGYGSFKVGNDFFRFSEADKKVFRELVFKELQTQQQYKNHDATAEVSLADDVVYEDPAKTSYNKYFALYAREYANFYMDENGNRRTNHTAAEAHKQNTLTGQMRKFTQMQAKAEVQEEQPGVTDADIIEKLNGTLSLEDVEALIQDENAVMKLFEIAATGEYRMQEGRPVKKLTGIQKFAISNLLLKVAEKKVNREMAADSAQRNRAGATLAAGEKGLGSGE